MLAHVSIGVRDMTASRRFYDAVFTPLGYRCLYPDPGSAGYGAENAGFWLNLTEHPVPADMRSGLHICFDAKSREGVQGFYKAALANGGKDNGAPGVRQEYSPDYYAAFVVDPDGYRIEAYTSAS